MKFNPFFHPYPSQRMTMYARRGMVATSQPLAAQAGLEVLKRGGNAVDAAVATAAALTVVEPTSNGIGGDAFAIVWMKDKMYGLNASGPAPQALTRAGLEALGVQSMPKFGWVPVTVPGTPSAWASLCERFGRLSLEEVLQPAIRYARDGYPVSPVLAKYWGYAYRNYREHLREEHFSAWFDTFAPAGRAPLPGEMWASPHHADTLQDIGSTGSASFYRGRLAGIIDDFSRRTGGYLRAADLAAFEPEWVTPLSVNYRGYDVWELPPNGQGMVALMALNILKGFDFDGKDSALTYHRQIEAIKLAFADGREYITDARRMAVRPEDLLTEAYAAVRRERIGSEARLPEPGRPPGGGTVYLATADEDGNMVSYIQSNYMGFGSGLVVPGTGIGLQNRGHTFSLDPSAANVLEPGKRTYHTIIPGFVTQGQQAVGPFGVMGGYMQPQGHVQVIANAVDFQLNPQAALDAPRWQWVEGNIVELERSVPAHIAESLARMGHQVRIATDSGGFGRGQIIWRNASGVLAGGTEPRTDGHIAVW